MPAGPSAGGMSVQQLLGMQQGVGNAAVSSFMTGQRDGGGSSVPHGTAAAPGDDQIMAALVASRGNGTAGPTHNGGAAANGNGAAAGAAGAGAAAAGPAADGGAAANGAGAAGAGPAAKPAPDAMTAAV